MILEAEDLLGNIGGSVVYFNQQTGALHADCSVIMNNSHKHMKHLARMNENFSSC